MSLSRKPLRYILRGVDQWILHTIKTLARQKERMQLIQIQENHGYGRHGDGDGCGSYDGFTPSYLRFCVPRHQNIRSGERHVDQRASRRYQRTS
jgi:hypothetical protein